MTTATTTVRIQNKLERGALLGVLGSRFEGHFEDALRGTPGTSEAVNRREQLRDLLDVTARYDAIGDWIDAMDAIAGREETIDVPMERAELVENLREEARTMHELINPPVALDVYTAAVAAHLALADRIEAAQDDASQHGPCARCGDPDARTTPRSPNEPLCDDCARHRETLATGEARAAIVTLSLAVCQLRDAGISRAQVRETFHEVLRAPHSTLEIPIGSGVPEPVDHQPIAGAA